MEKMNVVGTGVNVNELKAKIVENNFEIMDNFTRGMSENISLMNKHLTLVFENFINQEEMLDCAKSAVEIKDQLVSVTAAVIKLNELFIDKASRIEKL